MSVCEDERAGAYPSSCKRLRSNLSVDEDSGIQEPDNHQAISSNSCAATEDEDENLSNGDEDGEYDVEDEDEDDNDEEDDENDEDEEEEDDDEEEDEDDDEEEEEDDKDDCEVTDAHQSTVANHIHNPHESQRSGGQLNTSQQNTNWVLFHTSISKLRKCQSGPEPNLLRSVLICNLLRRLEREMDEDGIKINYGPDGVPTIVSSNQEIMIDQAPQNPTDTLSSGRITPFPATDNKCSMEPCDNEQFSSESNVSPPHWPPLEQPSYLSLDSGFEELSSRYHHNNWVSINYDTC
ncbi:hypothetical protein GZH46_01612 [Fragariocoptes setiger]|uniref:SERTA domain-containing protein n=1 Tax=Fragariocoptes setiger TaxID=1670756 RepID=A0ABQ7S8V8_9ACAR|nr:hypothetical protein GZH46_01612 [Fragariocoptes setiger]